MDLSDAMSVFWTNMASSGDPNTWSGPRATHHKPTDLVAPPPPMPPAMCDPKQHQMCPSAPGSPPIPCPKCGKATCPCPPIPKPHHNRTLRPANHTFWWHYTGVDCDPGVEEGNCSNTTDCREKCTADPYCGGFNGKSGKSKSAVHRMKYSDCGASVSSSSETGMYLFFLRDTPMPPPPPPNINLPQNCSLFQQR